MKTDEHRILKVARKEAKAFLVDKYPHYVKSIKYYMGEYASTYNSQAFDINIIEDNLITMVYKIVEKIDFAIQDLGLKE